MPPPLPHPRDLRLAFVDLETTGTSATADRITEVGIITVDDGHCEQWSSLVHPQTHISGFIESLTGITNDMVAGAPLFEDLAPDILARLEGRLFIAHNARFDHGFLKNEFKRLGLRFAPEVLCTVKLSRKLFPGFSRHNLDALVERHRLSVSERHRALGDARLIWQFWNKLLDSIDPVQLATTVAELSARPALPVHIDPDFIDSVPDTHGVYLFYGENDLPLYIGKANRLRRRILSHFSGDHGSSKEMELSQQVRRIAWIDCPGELGALLREAALVRELSPIHNKRLRKDDDLCSWRVLSHPLGLRVQLASPNDLFYGHEQSLYGLYASPRQASNALRALADAHQLCPARLGLEKNRAGKPCFASQVWRCLGVCCSRESAAEHDQRMLLALESSRLAPWPWDGPIGLREGDSMHVLESWGYLGTVHRHDDPHTLLRTRRGSFERDTYLLLHKRLPGLAPQIVSL